MRTRRDRDAEVLNRMNKTLLSLVAAIALAGSAAAGFEAHLSAETMEDERTIDIWVNDDGTYTVLVDGESVVPALPGAPTPELPALPDPGVPEVPEPSMPTIPEVPMPGLPSIPTLP